MKLSSSAIPRRVLYLLGITALAGAAFAVWLKGTFAGQPDPRSSYNAFYVLFARNESWGLALVAIFSFAAAFFLSFPTAHHVEEQNPVSPNERAPRFLPHRMLVLLIAAGVFAITALGTKLVCHDYALSADEFMADFQAQIFLRGQITAEVPAKWLPALRAIKPTYVDYLPQTRSWKATYLPVYAAMRAAFQSVYLESFLNPTLAALTLFALYGVGRRIWPDNKQYALVAVLLLATSAQFLLMAMTSYSMPAHLALNTCWLWLYLHPERGRFYLAPILGVIALGLHQPIVHALFVAPFLLRLVWGRKWRAVSVYGVLYSLGCTFWALWRQHYLKPSSAPLGSFFHLFSAKMIVIQPMDLLLLLGWSSLATPLLALFGFRHFFRVPTVVQDAALSFALTFVFYYFFSLDQGHGWGYRYIHGSLCCLILVAVAGWHSLGEYFGSRNARHFLAAGVIASLLLALPLRCYEAESFIRPFARAAEMIHGNPSQIVAVNLLDTWYAGDLIRNDPFLRSTPIVAAAIPGMMSAAEVTTLNQAGRTRFISRPELAALGLATTPRQPSHFDPFHLGHGP